MRAVSVHVRHASGEVRVQCVNVVIGVVLGELLVVCSSVILHFATWFRCVLGLSEFQRASVAKASQAFRRSRPSRP